MYQRISLGEVYEQLRNSITQNYARLFQSQTQLTTGSRIQRPSDDPVGTRRLLGIKSQQAAIQRFQQSLTTGRAYLEAGASALQGISNSLARVRELATQAASGTLTSDDRRAVAVEVDSLLQAIVQAANGRVDERYLFSGTATTTLPFALGQGTDGLTRVRYLGNSQEQQVEVGPGVLAGLNIPGDIVFATGSRGETRFRGSTGAAPGAGTDSGTGRDRLLISHTATLYGTPPGPGGQDPLTGLRPGASSAGDNVLGPSHAITVTTDSLGNGAISMNGGPDVAFTPADTDLLVLGPAGERIHVDVSSLATNLPPTQVAVAGQGTLSTDGGRSTYAIDFTATAQQVVDSETGQVLHVDATGIRQAGEEEVSYEGTFDLFSAIVAIRDVLQDESLTQPQLNSILNGRIADLDRATVALTSALGTLGVRSAQLESTSGRLADLDITLSRLKSEIADVDLAEVLVEMKEQEALYQSSLLMVSRVNELSLLNYL